MSWKHPIFLTLLIFIPFFMVLIELRIRRIRRIAESIQHPYRFIWINRILSFSLLMFLLVLADPGQQSAEKEVWQRKQNIIFLIDVSRSMLAEDIYPSRLDRTKLMVQDFVQDLKGEQIALVAFGGTAVIKSPLTGDYSFFLQSLESLDPSSVARGGSLIGDAIRYISENVLTEDQKGLLFLFSDGEDQDSFPRQAAKALVDQGSQMVMLGIGDPMTGSPIPDGEGGYIQYQNKPVLTKLDESVLKGISQSSGQLYIPLQTGNLNLKDVYRRYSGENPGKLEKTTTEEWEPLFTLPVLLGIFSVVLYFVITLWGRRSNED